MMQDQLRILVRNISTAPEVPENEVIALAVRRLSGILPSTSLTASAVYRRSVDARRRGEIRLVRSVVLTYACTVAPNKLDSLTARLRTKADAVILEEAFPEIRFGTRRAKRPVIVGFGPAGMFAGLLLAQNGYRPLILERGGDTAERVRTVQTFFDTGRLDPECNVQFGAGGAGTFSDGKLVTRVNDPLCRFVLETFARFGAPETVLTEAKPHVGTDRLRTVVEGITQEIRRLGCEILFRTRAEDFCMAQDRVVSVKTGRGEIPCGSVILATGHSARDIYRLFQRRRFDVRPKPFSVGVRIEHLQSDIDRGLYGDMAGNPYLPKGEYALSCHPNGVGVYTFCMCPGGEVVAAASEEGGVVVNGMSRYGRDGTNACSAVCVSVTDDDPMRFQRQLEERAYQLAGGNYRAPVQTVGDFLAGKSGTQPRRVLPTYMEGHGASLRDLRQLFPQSICAGLEAGIRNFGRKLPGFDAPDAVLTGPETRTSAPYRIVRGEDLTASACTNLYPCGEGAGYAGGITSAALDGIHCALALMREYAPY